MTPKKITVAALILVLLFVGVKYSLVYINYIQLKSIMSSEALDARRTGAPGGEIEQLIYQRVDDGSAHLPDEVAFEFEGIDKPEDDLVIFADYVEVVDLVVIKHEMKMSITAVAEPPID